VFGKKAATSANAASRGQKYGGLFTLRATPTPGRTPEDLEAMLYAELEKIVKDGITDQELERAKNYHQVNTYVRLESITGLRDALIQAEATGTYRDLLENPTRIQAVTKEDVQRVAKEYLVRENRNILITKRKGSEDPESRVKRMRERMQKTEAK
jgi:predicted Zn-dependent peptidase